MENTNATNIMPLTMVASSIVTERPPSTRSLDRTNDERRPVAVSKFKQRFTLRSSSCMFVAKDSRRSRSRLCCGLAWEYGWWSRGAGQGARHRVISSAQLHQQPTAAQQQDFPLYPRHTPVSLLAEMCSPVLAEMCSVSFPVLGLNCFDNVQHRRSDMCASVCDEVSSYGLSNK